MQRYNLTLFIIIRKKKILFLIDYIIYINKLKKKNLSPNDSYYFNITYFICIKDIIKSIQQVLIIGYRITNQSNNFWNYLQPSLNPPVIFFLYSLFYYRPLISTITRRVSREDFLR